jgi:hypothetical protein
LHGGATACSGSPGYARERCSVKLPLYQVDAFTSLAGRVVEYLHGEIEV